MPALQILGIDHVVFRVADLSRALDFYQDFLGCEIEREVPALGLTQLRAGNALIDLVPVDSKLGKSGGGPVDANAHNVDHVCLRIEPWEPEALRIDLQERGIEASEVATRYGAGGNGPSIYIQDPDGNSIELKGPPGAAK